MESADAPEKPWDQQPGEPNLWFKRFSLYLLMGPTRTVGTALRAATGLRYQRLLDATRHKLAEVIKIQYRLRRPLPMLQIALPAGIPPAEATIVSREFWQGIGSGKDPQAALEEALAHCAPDTTRWVEARFAEPMEA